MNEFLGRFLPEIGSAHGPQLDHMLGIVHWLMLVLFIGWGSFFLYTLFRFRSSRNKTADYHGVKSHVSSYLEFAVALFEVALLIGFAAPLWAQRVNEFPKEQDATIIRVVAEQFAWNVHYAGKDGVFGKTDPANIDKATNQLGLDREDPAALDDIIKTNELHLPVNKPAIIYLTSKDVIHSFGIPEMRVKQDAIPGLVTPLWFTPTVTTAEMLKIKEQHGKLNTKDEQAKFSTYEIACAQLCGNGHFRMRGYATVETPAEFQSWVDSQTPNLAGDDF